MKFRFLKSFFLPEMAGNRSKDRILNIFLTPGSISSVEEFRSDLKAKINIGAYPGGGLIYRYPLKTGQKRFFVKNHGRFWPDPAQILHGVILWYSPQLILDLARSQKSVVYLPPPLPPPPSQFLHA